MRRNNSYKCGNLSIFSYAKVIRRPYIFRLMVHKFTYNSLQTELTLKFATLHCRNEAYLQHGGR